jgi:hypothetical protein
MLETFSGKLSEMRLIALSFVDILNADFIYCQSCKTFFILRQLRSGKKLPTVIIPAKLNIFVPEAVAKLLEQSNSEPKFYRSLPLCWRQLDRQHNGKLL